MLFSAFSSFPLSASGWKCGAYPFYPVGGDELFLNKPSQKFE